MVRPGFQQAVMQSMLATAFIFAATLGYWSVGSYQTSSADADQATASTRATTDVVVTPGPTLAKTLALALALSIIVSSALLYRSMRRLDADAVV